MTNSIYLNELGIICALGDNKANIRKQLFHPQIESIPKYSTDYAHINLCLGKIETSVTDVSVLPPAFRSYNNALLLTALAQIKPAVDIAIHRFGKSRIAVVLGTSTSGIAESEQAIYQYTQSGKIDTHFHLAQQEIGSGAIAISNYLKLSGPTLVISTACSSSAKSITSAARLLQSDLCDAVIVGGMDSLCHFTVSGFSALDSISSTRCNPLSLNRDGIHIGEGGALFLMTREPGPVRLAGWGESSDAHHISAPLPNGSGALSAMKKALHKACIEPNQVDYINLHGTATPQNDSMESKAIHQLFGSTIPASSTKPLTGHVLGGTGALEAGFCWLALTENPEGMLPSHVWDGIADPTLSPVRLVQSGEKLNHPVKYALTNSFAFGGSNISLLLEATHAAND